MAPEHLGGITTTLNPIQTLLPRGGARRWRPLQSDRTTSNGEVKP